MSRYHLIVDQDNANIRLDVYLTQMLVDLPSRTFVKKVIEDGKVSVNGQIQKARYKVCVGDVIDMDFSDEMVPDRNLKPEKIKLDVFYQDEALVVINKPVGMTVHPASGNYSGTLANALLYYFKELSDLNPGRPGIVHRLDKETSGLIVVAKTNQAHARLGRQFERHTVLKKYLAIVHGNVKFDQGKIEVPLKRHSKYHDMRQVASPGEGKEALTFYEVIKRGDKKTLVGLYPQTGRTHQLRVHMKYLGHPILGDDRYGAKESFSRLALHAQLIGFEHPLSRRWVEFSSQLPKEFHSFS